MLSRLFRGKFIGYLREAFARGELIFHGELEVLSVAEHFAGWVRDVAQQEWVVYAKLPFGGPAQVLKYLSRYTHRVAISNRRLVAFQDGQVTFRWKDYADGNADKQMTLSTVEFTRRFLLHVLPHGFVRIRHYGFLANRCRRNKLSLCKRLLGQPPAPEEPPGGADESQPDEQRESDVCPVCHAGRMVVVERLEPGCTRLTGSLMLVPHSDSS